jgi:hypothetical protein
MKVGLGVAGAIATFTSGTVGALAQPYNGSVRLDQNDHSDQNDQDWARRIENALGGTKGKFEDNGVFKIDLPRTDIKATIDGVDVDPDFALDGELTFKRVGNDTAMKFEVVLLDNEVNPVLYAWLDQNIEPKLEQFTALHNHYLFDSPPIRFMHGFAVGNETKIAHALYLALKNNSSTPFGHKDVPSDKLNAVEQRITDILGGTGEDSHGILTVSVSRKEDFRQRGVKLPSEMEFDSVFNFQWIGGGNVASIGEFVVLKDEADPVARELRRHNIKITALHSHELDVEPQVYYMHTWTKGKPEDVAHALRAALNKTNSQFT